MYLTFDSEIGSGNSILFCHKLRDSEQARKLLLASLRHLDDILAERIIAVIPNAPLQMKYA